MHKDFDTNKHQRRFFALATLIFTLVGIGHLLRIVYNWPINIAGWPVPMSISYLVVLLAVSMMVMGWYYLKN